MRKQVYSWLIIALLSTTLFGQKATETKKESASRGAEIIDAARKAVGTEKIIVNSFSLKTNIFFGKTAAKGNSLDEIKVLFPGKIHIVQNTNLSLTSSITTKIWNDEKYKAVSESEFQGERYVSDITNDSSNANYLKKVGAKIGKEKANKVKDYKSSDPKEQFYSDMWKLFFPLVLIQPYEQNAEFNYVGKAKSENTVANVVDVKTANEKSYRLIFDSETNHLLMMIQSYRGETKFSGEKGLYETKYYYSNREKTGDLLIPKKIKVEYKFTPDGKEPKVSYENIDILEFSVNPEFKANTFEIK